MCKLANTFAMTQLPVYLEDRLLKTKIDIEQVKQLLERYNRRKIPIIRDEEFIEVLASISISSLPHIEELIKAYVDNKEEALHCHETSWDSVRFDILLPGLALYESQSDQRLFTSFISLESLESVKKFVSVLLPKLIEHSQKRFEPKTREKGLPKSSDPAHSLSDPDKFLLRRSARIAKQANYHTRNRSKQKDSKCDRRTKKIYKRQRYVTLGTGTFFL